MAFFIMEFAYNNAKNINISHTLFKLNYKYYVCVSYKKDLNLCLKLKIVEELFFEFWNLMTIY